MNIILLELHQIKENRHNAQNIQNKNYNSENRTILKRGQFQIIWTHRSQVSFLTGSNKHSCCKFFHVFFLLRSSVFSFSHFSFVSCLRLFLHMLFSHPLLHLRIVLARYLPGCMQRTLSHVISPLASLLFFCADLLLVVRGVVFCQQ